MYGIKGSGLGPLSSDTRPVGIVISVYFWTCVIIRPGLVYRKHWTCWDCDTGPVEIMTCAYFWIRVII